MKAHDDQIRLSHQVSLVAGIDEAGRGPLAGPVVAAAVILDANANLKIVNDSKKLSKIKREQALKEIKENALSIGIGIATNEEIDQINIRNATILAMKRALNNLEIKPEIVLIDYMEIKTDLKQLSITKGDQISLAIAAASVVAKTYRDSLMLDYDKKYPQYGFKNHMGYPTKHHVEMIQKHGVSPIHRLTFKPIKDLK